MDSITLILKNAPRAFSKHIISHLTKKVNETAYPPTEKSTA